MFRFAYGANYTGNCVAKPMSRSVKAVLVNRFPVAHDVSIQIALAFTESTPALNMQRVQEIYDAMAVPGSACGIQYYDGAAWVNTSYWLAAGGLDGPTASDITLNAKELEHISEYNMQFTLSAMYSNTTMGRTLIELIESVDINGDGGSLWELAPQATALSTYQKTQEYTNVYVMQSGRVTSKGSTISAVPTPLIVSPAGAKISPQTRLGRRWVQSGTGILMNEATYSYSFQLNAYPGTVLPNYLT